MSEPTADRAKALLSARAAKVARSLTHPDLLPFEGRVDRIAAALASERAAAVADLRARVEAVAEEWEANGGWDLDYAARLRAAVTDTTGGTP